MAPENPNFSGWTAVDSKACDGGLVFKEFEPKPWEEDDIDGMLR
jgi:alcohol dehydrogenase (NADP+)